MTSEERKNNSNTESKFSVCTLTKMTDTKSKYTHWSDGLEMYIQKDGKSIKLDSEEIEELVKTLPRTIGGSY